MNSSRSIPGKENMERINYLIQLSNEFATESPCKHVASIQYSKLAVDISKKTVQRLDSQIKNAFCKSCRTVLIPGVTCKVNIKKKRLVRHCLKCKNIKIFDIRNRNYVPWIMKDESVVERIDFNK